MISSVVHILFPYPLELTENHLQIHSIALHYKWLPACSFGIGNFVDNLVNIPQAYQEAKKALQTGYVRNKKPFIRTFRTEEVNELLRMIPHSKLEQFYKLSLRELAFPDQEEKKELLFTLQTYLDHHCQVTETTKQLFIHRNTVLYRIAKCEEILGVNLKEQPEESACIAY